MMINSTYVSKWYLTMIIAIGWYFTSIFCKTVRTFGNINYASQNLLTWGKCFCMFLIRSSRSWPCARRQPFWMLYLFMPVPGISIWLTTSATRHTPKSISGFSWHLPDVVRLKRSITKCSNVVNSSACNPTRITKDYFSTELTVRVLVVVSTFKILRYDNVSIVFLWMFNLGLSYFFFFFLNTHMYGKNIDN